MEQRLLRGCIWAVQSCQSRPTLRDLWDTVDLCLCWGLRSYIYTDGRNTSPGTRC